MKLPAQALAHSSEGPKSTQTPADDDGEYSPRLQGSLVSDGPRNVSEGSSHSILEYLEGSTARARFRLPFRHVILNSTAGGTVVQIR